MSSLTTHKVRPHPTGRPHPYSQHDVFLTGLEETSEEMSSVWSKLCQLERALCCAAARQCLQQQIVTVRVHHHGTDMTFSLSLRMMVMLRGLY